jgi:hypothetical protein
MEKTSNLDYYWQEVERALELLDKDDNQMSQLLENCLRDLALQNNLVEDSDYHHLKGYIYYSFRPQKLIEAKAEFEKALDLDYSNSYSRLYLGHTFYDVGEYQEAQTQFLKIKKNSLPDWLMMKAEEMIVCCKLHLSPITAERDIQDFLQKYVPLDYLDDYPFELSKLLKQRGRNLENEALKYQYLS